MWIRSGLWLSSAHAGHGALRPCIHSMLFSFPHLCEVHKKCFLKSSHSSKRKKKVLAFTFTHTWIVAFHLIPNIFQLRSTAQKYAPFLPLHLVVLASGTCKQTVGEALFNTRFLLLHLSEKSTFILAISPAGNSRMNMIFCTHTGALSLC